MGNVTASDPAAALRAGARAPRLVLRFAVATAAGLTLAAAIILIVVQNAYTLQAERHAIDRTRLTVAAVLADRLRPSDFTRPVSASRRRQLDRTFATRVLGDDIVVGTVYGPTGRITYSTDPRSIGSRDPSRVDIGRALSGQVASRVTGRKAGKGRVLQTDVPVAVGRQGVRGVVSIDQDYGPIASAAKRS